MIGVSECLLLRNVLPESFKSLCDLIIRYIELKNHIFKFVEKGRFNPKLLDEVLEVVDRIIVEHLSLLKGQGFTDDDLKTVRESIKSLLTCGMNSDDLSSITDLYQRLLKADKEGDIKLLVVLLFKKYSNFINHLYQLLKNTYDKTNSNFINNYRSDAIQLLKVYPVYEKTELKKIQVSKEPLIGVGKVSDEARKVCEVPKP